jgi:hypothetical protein
VEQHCQAETQSQSTQLRPKHQALHPTANSCLCLCLSQRACFPRQTPRDVYSVISPAAPLLSPAAATSSHLALSILPPRFRQRDSSQSISGAASNVHHDTPKGIPPQSASPTSLAPPTCSQAVHTARPTHHPARTYICTTHTRLRLPRNSS